MMSSSDSKTHDTKLSKNKKEKKDLPTELTHVKINKCQNKQKQIPYLTLVLQVAMPDGCQLTQHF